MYTAVVKFSTALLNTHPFFARGAVFFCLLGVGALLYIYRPLPDVVVTRTERGFVPSSVTIRTGQAVVFKTTTGKPFWPASNFHPSHALYPAFDPKHQIEETDTWRFVFNDPGRFPYHDHMEESVRGVVIVRGKAGESSAACMNSANTNPGVSKTDCWAIDLTETLSSKGLDAAFDQYADIYAKDPTFRGLSCHDVGHILGAAAYARFQSNHAVIDRPETSYCGYGFYHGFIETMLLENGAAYNEVRAYCDALKTNGVLNNPSGACYHGIGHAALDSLPGSLWGDEKKMVDAAVAVCEQAAIGAPEQAQCTTGVYNALAVAASAHRYNLSFPSKPSMHICDVQKIAYQAGCYVEYGIGTIREFRLDRAETVRLIMSAPETKLSAAMLRGYASDEVMRSMTALNLPSFVSFCHSFSDTVLRNACNTGVIAGLRQGGQPGKEFVQGFAYCSLIKDASERTLCTSQVASQTRLIATDQDAFRRACTALETSDPTICN